MLSYISEATKKFNKDEVKRNIVISLNTDANLPSMFHINNVKSR